jgi:hypothetical protein
VLENLVGATGIEPVTSPMSTMREGFYPLLLVLNTVIKAMISKKFSLYPLLPNASHFNRAGSNRVELKGHENGN